jgi:hypothetical protein
MHRVALRMADIEPNDGAAATLVGGAVGLFAGIITASALDAAVLAYEPPSPARERSRAVVTPTRGGARSCRRAAG